MGVNIRENYAVSGRFSGLKSAPVDCVHSTNQCLPVLFSPHSDIQAIYKPYTSHIQAIYKPYTSHIQAIYKPYSWGSSIYSTWGITFIGFTLVAGPSIAPRHAMRRRHRLDLSNLAVSNGHISIRVKITTAKGLLKMVDD